jgi:uncharacterized protein YneF (UPF0154 family)
MEVAGIVLALIVGVLIGRYVVPTRHCRMGIPACGVRD